MKQLFDIVLAVLFTFIMTIPLFFILILNSFNTNSNGLFLQKRIGQYGQPFIIYKFRTLHKDTGELSRVGKFLRENKIDEIPQLINILKGEMSFVGPRPDVPGYYDKLEGEYKKILELKPGLTSEASIKYANEEEILSKQKNPLEFNDNVIFPDKVKMNLEYYYNRSFLGDIKIIVKTIFRK